MNERLQRMRNKLYNSRPCITAERLELATQAYQKFAGDATPIFRAKVGIGNQTMALDNAGIPKINFFLVFPAGAGGVVDIALTFFHIAFETHRQQLGVVAEGLSGNTVG